MRVSLLVLAVGCLVAGRALACPFCTALGPTLCQQRADAVVTALGEIEGRNDAGESSVLVHQVLAGRSMLQDRKSLSIPLDLAAAPGTLVLVFGSGPPEASLDKLRWHAVAVNETSYAYFARAQRHDPAGRTAGLFRAVFGACRSAGG